jgi:hypothetical protein
MRVTRLIVRDEGRPILIDVGYRAGGHTLMNQIEKRTVSSFDERQPFAIPSARVAKENFEWVWATSAVKIKKSPTVTPSASPSHRRN